MILEEALNKLIRDTINLLLASPGYTIKAKQLDAPRPVGPYGDVDFVADTSIGTEQRKYADNASGKDLDVEYTGMREIMMSINFYRDNSIDNARKCRIGLVRESTQEIFSEAGVGLGTRSPVREISTPLENGWEERAQFDIVLSAVGTDTDIIKAILSANISASYQANGDEYNSTIEV